jgi:hypothetical protein
VLGLYLGTRNDGKFEGIYMYRDTKDSAIVVA